MKKIPIYGLMALLLFCSCNNPMSREYSSRSFEDDLTDMRESGKIDEEDISLLIEYAVVQKISGSAPNGDTYEEILDRIKKLKENEEDFAEQEKKNESIKRERLNPYLDVKVLDKSYSKVDQNDCLVYTIEFQNLSNQQIKTVIGNIRLSDKLEKEIKKIDIVLDAPLEPKTILKKTYAIAYNHNSEDDRRVRSKSLFDMRIEWNPDKIIFNGDKFAE